MYSHKDIRVLIAEDNLAVSTMLKVTLEKRGYTIVGEAANGSQAVEMTQSLRPDVVLMDIIMPHMDGIKATQQIHASCPTPVVMLTAYEMEELVTRSSKVGVGAYLVKPPNIYDIERAITIAMARFEDMMKLRRLNAELRARDKERRVATQLKLICGIVQRISPIVRLDDLLPRMAHLIQETFGYDNVRISLVEANGDERITKVAGGPLSKSSDPRSHLKIEWEEAADRAAHNGPPLLVNDAGHDPSRGPWPGPKGARSELTVPIRLHEKMIGVLNVQRSKPDVFGQEDRFLLQTLADRLGVAIENARLYQQTDEKLQARMRELGALHAIARAINQPFDLRELLQLALDSAIELTGMDSGGIFLCDPSTNEVFLSAYRGWSPELAHAVSHTRADLDLMPRLFQSVLMVDDKLPEVTKECRAAIEKEGLRSVLSTPLKTQSPLGVMSVTSHHVRASASEELEWLAAIGYQVGVAVDRANLQARELRAAVLEERQAMARQMHDDIAQTLSYLGLRMDNLMGGSILAHNQEEQAELEEIRSAIEDAYERVRSSIIRLQGEIPEQFNLSVALRRRIREFEEQAGCRTEFQVDPDYLLRLSPAIAFQAAYIVQEALTNVRKHAGADTVRVTLCGREDGMVEIAVQDNGRGFDLDGNPRAGQGNFGLRFMRERAERAGGRLEIESRPGQGTRVVVSLPTS